MRLPGFDNYISTIPVLHDVPDPDDQTECIHCREYIIDEEGNCNGWDCYVEKTEEGLEWSYWHVGCKGKLIN